ncbi:MAG: class I SAM-dependent methyltransferase [Bifidobacteriaceae bacterium]|jgi:predicted O-methyltransferase YrrM|nr:class I SAM-dependent methyltransferase [Bifidobacteriaceae bacterium]
MAGSVDYVANWVFAEDFLPEPDALAHARSRARELGVPALSPATGALLEVIAASLKAASAVEIGTSAGVGIVHLLSAMPPGAIVTSVDMEAEHQHAAREALREAGIPLSQVRLINSRPAEVLPRLADEAYDLVLLGGSKLDYMNRLADAIRLLKPGGVLAVIGALADGRVPDPARRDPVTVTVREVGKELRRRGDLTVAMSAAGDGLLLAVKRPRAPLGHTR